ncbi:MAG: DEAD/DEAH box helicase, partial [Pseudomonadota bacterium]
MSEPGHFTVSGAPEGFDARLVLREAAERPVLHVARDDKRLAAMAEALRVTDPSVPVMAFPGWDCLPYDRVSPNADVSAARMATLAALAAGAPRGVVLTTLNAATQRVPARALLREAAFSARVGDRIDEDALRAFLVRMGFVQAPTVSEPGDYAIRGGIIDIYPPGEAGPVRLDLFGDVLDGARRFDPVTQRTTETLERVELAPVSEVILDEAAITRFRQSYRAEFGSAGTDDPLYEAVSAGRKHAGVEHWLPFFHDGLETLFDYLPGAAVVLDDQVTPQRLARWDTIADQYDARAEALKARSKHDTVYKPAPPGALYLDDAAWGAAVAGHRVLSLAQLPQATGPGVTDASGRIGRDFAPERQQESISLFGALAAHIQAERETRSVVIASYSEGARERLQGLLEDQDITDATPVADLRDVSEGAGTLSLMVWALEHGFTGPGLTVISEQDVLGDRLIRAPRKKRRAENFLTEHQTLSPGDLIVHVDHGVGRYMGLEVVTALGAAHECLSLEYAGGDRLFLPVENIELLSRFGHEEGLLDRLGGGAWQAKKAKLKQRIRDIADRLIRVAAERHLRKGRILEPSHGLWESFSARFPYQETDDQLNAIEDVLSDLASGTPMDRLVCGDVGFGKTEVAMRAAFIAAMSGAQVAVIAPTTLLARQHFKSFAERFRGFPVEVRQLSRFVSAKEAQATREGLAKGTVDIVIGTHAVLAKSVRFQDLGLLVIDEEQHFGVAHKERLKQLK